MSKKEFNTCEFENQGATKITSALADSRIQFLLDDDVTFGENIVLVLASYDHFSAFHLFLTPLWPCHHQNRLMLAEWTDGQRILLSARKTITTKLWHSINLVFDEENVKPEKLTKAPENAGIDPSTMRVSKWYQGPTREDDDPHFPSSNRVSDIFTGVDRASYQEQEPIENDEDRLAMKSGDMPPTLPKRVANPRVQEDQALQEFIRTRTRCSVLHASTQAWID